MATKKQKRLIGEKKQEANRLESIRTGLLAQKKSREREAAEQKKRAQAFERSEKKRLSKERAKKMNGMANPNADDAQPDFSDDFETVDA